MLAMSSALSFGQGTLQELQSSLDVDEATLARIAKMLTKARGSESLRPYTLLRHAKTGSQEVNDARLVYMRLTNLLWDAKVLPIPFTPNGPELIPRKRLDDLFVTVKPLVLKLLTKSNRTISNERCLEWGTEYTTRYFGSICTLMHSLEYTPGPTAQRLVQVNERTAKIKVDLCTSEFSAAVLEEITRRGGLTLVLATAVWEHLTHPVRCLTNLVQMMAPGGVLVLTVPFMYPYHRVPEDYFRYTPDGMAQVALQSGLKVAHAFGMGTRRETDALNNGFWVSALPDHVHSRAVGDKWKNTDGFFHSSVVIAIRPL